MYESEIEKIKEYIKELDRPNNKMQKNNFRQLSYSKWAANEILYRVMQYPDVNPILLVEQFAFKMNDYSCKHGPSSFPFSVAYDISMNILDILMESQDPHILL